jgi:predicted Zn-dependent protease
MRIIRIIIALVVALGSLIAYYAKTEKNPVTGEEQHIDITVEQEIALGLQAAPQMAEQFGGLHSDPALQALVDKVGHHIVDETVADKSPYNFDFHVLADEETINAFALPGGQVFITAGLMKRLTTEDQLAGVLGHEIGHVIGRHSAEHIAKARLQEGLTGAAVLATYDPGNPSTTQSAAITMLIGNLIGMKYGRDDELEADRMGVDYLYDSEYKPEAMIDVMRILAEAGGRSQQPEFFSTHPNPENRIAEIEKAIRERAN